MRGTQGNVLGAVLYQKVGARVLWSEEERPSLFCRRNKAKNGVEGVWSLEGEIGLEKKRKINVLREKGSICDLKDVNERLSGGDDSMRMTVRRGQVKKGIGR